MINLQVKDEASEDANDSHLLLVNIGSSFKDGFEVAGVNAIYRLEQQ